MPALQRVGTFAETNELTNGSEYGGQATVIPPAGISGDYYFFVVTNSDGAVFENGLTANNIGVSSVVFVNPAVLPQLDVTSINVPSAALASHALTFSYTVANVGAAGVSVNSWSDAYYLSPTPAFNAATAISLGSKAIDAALSAGSGYSEGVNVTLPDGISGTYYLLVETDSGNAILQQTRADDLEASGSIQISSQPADLAVTAASAPSMGSGGNAALVTWTVVNQGSGDTAINTWNDAVYGSTSPTFDSSAVFLESFTHNGLLAVGGSYQQSQIVTLPFGVTGNYYLFVVTNLVAPGQNAPVYEAGATANNVSTALPISMVQNPADLEVTQVGAPTTATPGTSVNITWTVADDGAGPTNAGYWDDDVWVSTNTTLGTGGDDVYLGTLLHNTQLSSGGSYQASLNVTLPATLAGGNYYFIVATNRPVAPPNDPNNQGVENLYESNFSNNETATSSTTAIAALDLPQLSVSNIVLPAAAYAGQPLTVSWTVTNTGGAAYEFLNNNNSYIWSTVYLSLDQVLDPSDRFLGSDAEALVADSNNDILAPGASYTETVTFQVPAGVSGSYYVFVQANSNDQLQESNPADSATENPQPLEIGLTPPTNLVAGTVTTSVQSAAAGQSILVNYNVENDGSSPADGIWTDALYLSPTPTWNLNDPLLAEVEQSQDLAPGHSYQDSTQVSLPGVLPGNYYVIVRANILDQLPETSLADNESASAATIAVGANSLALGVPSTFDINAGQSAYYQVTVAAGQTLQFFLEGGVADNELYVSYGTMPTRSQFDYRYTPPAEPDLTITIPTTQAGTYYVMAYDETVPRFPAAYTLTATEIPFSVTSAVPNSVGNAGSATIEIDGSLFDRATTFQLIASGGAVIQATSTSVQDATTADATFNLAGVPTGSYTVQATESDGTTTQLASGLTITAGVGGQFNAYFSGPGTVLVNRISSFAFNYENTGDADIGAPLIYIESPSNTLTGFSAAGVQYGNTPAFLAINNNGPAGYLPPGYQSNESIYFQSSPVANAANDFQYQVIGPDSTAPVLWSTVLPWVGPSYQQSPEWPAAEALLQQWIGGTWGGLVQLLDKNAALVSTSTGFQNTPGFVFDIAVQKAMAAVSTSISGTLQTSDLTLPISGQNLIAQNTTTGDTFATQTFNDGSFAFSDLTAGSYTFELSGAIVGAMSAVAVSQGEQVTGVDVPLTLGDVISGSVLANGTSTAIAGATVTAIDPSGNSYTAQTDDAGNYTITGLPDNTYSVYVSASNSGSAVVTGVTVTSAGAVENFSLLPGGTIAGSIAPSNSGPANPSFSIFAEVTGNTDPNQEYSVQVLGGAFSLNGLPAGTYTVTINATGYVTQTISNVMVSAGQTENLGTITPFVGATISGQITSTVAILPAAGATVDLYQGTTLVAAVFADGSGNFEFTGLAAGPYTIESGQQFVGVSNTVQETVVAAQNVSGVEINIYPGATISGTATDTLTGDALEVPVTLVLPDGSTIQTETDSSGAYEFTGLAPGNYAVSLEIPSANAYQAISVISPTATYTANLTSAFPETLSGVLLAADGTPISGGTVSLYLNGQDVADTSSAADGSFGFLLVQPGTFDLQATDGGMTFAGVTGIVVGTGQAVTQNLTAGDNTVNVNVSGSGTSSDSNIVELFYLQEGAWQPVSSTTITGNSDVSFTDLAPGQYQVLASGLGNLATIVGTTLTEGVVDNVNATMVATGEISGTVTDSNNNPLANAQIFITEPSDPTFLAVAMTAADGTYIAPQLPDGTFDISFVVNGYLTSVQTSIVVADADTATANAALPLSSTSLTGTVLDASGNPLVNANIEVDDAQGHLLGGATTGADGSFTINTAAGSNLKVVISQTAYAPLTENGVNVSVGATVSLGTLTPTAVADPPSALAGLSEGLALGGFAAQILTAFATFAAPVANPWVNQVNQEIATANGILAKAQALANSTLPTPSCPQAQPAYDNAINQLQTLSGLLGRFSTSIGNTQELNVEFAVAYTKDWSNILSQVASLASPELGFFKLAVQFPKFASAINAVPLLFDALSAVVNFASAANTLATPGNFGQTVDVQSNVNNAAQALASTLNVALNGLSGFASSGLLALSGNLTQQQLIQQLGYTGLGKTLSRPSVAQYLNFASTAGSVVSGFSLFVSFATGKLFANSDTIGPVLDRAEELMETLQTQVQIQMNVTLKAIANYYDNYVFTNCNPPPPPPPPPPQPVDPPPAFDWMVTSRAPTDPNNIIGPNGFSEANYVAANQILPYTIDFENEPTAGLPAQQVTVTQQLDPGLNWQSFRLGSFGFGGQTYTVPANSAFYQTTIDLSQTEGFDVDVLATINVETGVATWIFTTIDPSTGQIPVDPTIGFLPPDDSAGVGEGFVSYTIDPNTSDSTGTVINAQATVTFLSQSPLNTPQIFNTIDDSLDLTSSIANLPTYSPTNFTVSWSGSDGPDGAGIAGYDIYVSDNHGPYTLWLQNTSLTSAPYVGQIGHTYGFYSIALDNVGNVQAALAVAQQMTTIVSTVATQLVISESPSSLAAGGAITLTITAEDASNDVVAGFSDTVILADSLAGGSFSAVTFSGGVATVTATLDAAGSRRLRPATRPSAR